MNSTTFMSEVNMVQTGLWLLMELRLVDFMYPPPATLHVDDKFDFIIVGGGTAGCVLASRLTEISHYRVLLVEAGPVAPLETLYPGLTGTLYESYVDWNYTSVDDGENYQNHKGHVTPLSRGRMLGGSSASNRMLYMRGNPDDYNAWATAAKDDSWKWRNMLPYYIKSERLQDPDVANFTNTQIHGTGGFLGISRQLKPEVQKYLEAFGELEYDIPLDTDSGVNVYYEPLFTIADQTRQSTAYAYLTPVRTRNNLHVAYNTLVTKITFDYKKQATGVVVRTAYGEVTLGVNLEVVLTAGAINTPQLLMLSGVGPEQFLQTLGIPAVANVPEVGKNLRDHHVVLMPYRMDALDLMAAPPKNGLTDVLPTIAGYVALDRSKTVPDYQVLGNVLKDSATLLAVCALTFRFDDRLCDALVRSVEGYETFLVGLSLLHPKSSGEILLRSADPLDPPLIYTGYYSESEDLEKHAKYMEHFNSGIMNTTFFKKVIAQLLPIDKSCGNDWKCMARRSLANVHHSVGTCALGSVLNARLSVKGVEGQRVADASAIPVPPSGDTLAPTVVLAERAADIIKADYNVGWRLSKTVLASIIA